MTPPVTMASEEGSNRLTNHLFDPSHQIAAGDLIGGAIVIRIAPEDENLSTFSLVYSTVPPLEAWGSRSRLGRRL